MNILFVLFLVFSRCDDIDLDEEKDQMIQPAVLSDFITSRQTRNITMSGKKELTPIIGQYFRKPLVELVQSIQPTVLSFRSMYFKSFDGILIKGEARGFARFASISMYNCDYHDANAQAIYLSGSSSPGEYDDADGE